MIKKGISSNKNEIDALKEIKEQINQDNMGGIIFFCSRDYNLEKLEDGLSEFFDCPIIGCTTAGEINPNYTNGSIIASSFSGDKFTFHINPILDVKNFNVAVANKQIEETKKELKFNSDLDSNKMFAFLLNDGTSMHEELIAAILSRSLNGISMIGGTAGDNFEFTSALVYANGKFRDD